MVLVSSFGHFLLGNAVKSQYPHCPESLGSGEPCIDRGGGRARLGLDLGQDSQMVACWNQCGGRWVG
jgi:hypothetical protein